MKTSITFYFTILGLTAQGLTLPANGASLPAAYERRNVQPLFSRGDCPTYMIESGRATTAEKAEEICKSALGPDGQAPPGASSDTW